MKKQRWTGHRYRTINYFIFLLSVRNFATALIQTVQFIYPCEITSWHYTPTWAAEIEKKGSDDRLPLDLPLMSYNGLFYNHKTTGKTRKGKHIFKFINLFFSFCLDFNKKLLFQDCGDNGWFLFEISVEMYSLNRSVTNKNKEIKFI